MNAYSSVFSSYIAGLVATKQALGYPYKTAEFYLHEFDKYCCLHTTSKTLSRELVIEWAKAKNQEKPATHRGRISPIRELGKYMQSMGVSDAFVLSATLHRKIERYVPHFFTKQELIAFFLACDNLKPHRGMNARHLVIPVFFRLLYCCGLRTCEARTLRVEDVDLQYGLIDILYSKGHKSRRIPISHEILELLRKYNKHITEIYPGRTYFFPTTKNGCYAGKSIGPLFRKIWKAAGLHQGCGSKSRAYDFRHHFALSNLNRWIASDTDINTKLPYLTRYMGHSSMESTDYYLHLVPEFFHTFTQKVRTTEMILPEVDYEEE